MKRENELTVLKNIVWGSKDSKWRPVLGRIINLNHVTQFYPDDVE